MSNLESRSSLINNNSFPIDDYMTFIWNNEHSWNDHKCFIINGGSDLKWSNAPSITNNYAQPMFANNSFYLGCSTGQKEMSLSLGVYNVTLKEYQQLIKWLDIYQVHELTFNYADEWHYIAKIASFGESTKYIIGKDEYGKDLYYAEFTIKWELQDLYVYQNLFYELSTNTQISEASWILYQSNNENDSTLKDPINFSDVDFPLYLTINEMIAEQNTSIYFYLTIQFEDNTTQQISLFNLKGNFLSEKPIEVEYNSEWKTITVNRQLISNLSVNNIGDRIISSMYVNGYTFPCENTLDCSNPQINSIQLNWSIEHCSFSSIGLFVRPKTYIA